MALGLLALPIVLLLAGQAGMLQGHAPADLGVRDGRLKPPASTPNSVSSQASLHPGHPQGDGAAIEPLPLLPGGGPQTIERLKAIVEAMPGARVVRAEPDYLYAEFSTRWLRFVDDAEFWFDPVAGAVQVRSASRLGRSDLGVNRARIETIRAQLMPPLAQGGG